MDNESEFDLDLIGHGTEISPHACPDRKIGTLERELSFKHADPLFLMEGGDCFNPVRLPFDGHCPGYVELMVAHGH